MIDVMISRRINDYFWCNFNKIILKKVDLFFIYWQFFTFWGFDNLT